MDKNKDVMDNLYGLQEAIHNWGKLLIASGGALKLAKCFYHLISFTYEGDRTWS
jgi:hypothetical protein